VTSIRNHPMAALSVLVLGLLLLPIGILLVAAFASAFVRAPRRQGLAVHEQEAAVA